MGEELQEFLKNPSWEEFDKLRKPVLVELAQHYHLKFSSKMRKQEIKNLLIDALVEEEIFDQSLLQHKIVLEIPRTFDSNFEIKKLEMEMEMKKLEIEERKREKEFEFEERKREKEFEEREREREFEDREKERQAQVRLREIETGNVSNSSHRLSSGTSSFDATKHIRLVPRFQDKEVDKYFQHFEKIAVSLKWPNDQWTILLQSVLVGKAREVYTALDLVQSADCDKVKETILKAYELVPEAYRQKFRGIKKQSDQTHVEFARVKEQMFERWLTSKKTGNDYEKLKQLMLLEEFKHCLHSDIRTHLDEHEVDNLSKAATMADDYSLTHKVNFIKRDPNILIGSSKPGQFNSYPPNKTSEGHSKPDFGKGKGSNSSQSFELGGGNPSRTVPVCNYCKKRGHLLSECWTLKRKQERNESENPVPTAVTGIGDDDEKNIGQDPEDVPIACNAIESLVNTFMGASPVSSVNGSDSVDNMESFKPFITEGFVSLQSDETHLQPIKILRDTAAAQTLILEKVLPFSEQSSNCSEVLIKGVGSYINVPLHTVNLKSKLVSGPVTVGVRPTLPIKGISMLLGNDLAGDKVIPDPIVSSKPCLENEEEEQCFFPICAVTRSMAEKISRKETIDTIKDKTIEHDLGPGLEDSFFTRLDIDTKSLHEDDASRFLSDGGSSKNPLSHDRLIIEQQTDNDLMEIGQRALPFEEAKRVPICFYKLNGVLMRKWRPLDVAKDEEWNMVHQIVIPHSHQNDIISLAHNNPMSGHLGVSKTCDRILQHFYWPKLRQDIAEYCKSCPVCQIVGKPNQKIQVAPLQPIPAFEEPCRKVIVDNVGPLPKTKSGNIDNVCNVETQNENDVQKRGHDKNMYCIKLKNSDVLSKLDTKLAHLLSLIIFWCMVKILQSLFQNKVTVKLIKSDIGQAIVENLGHVVGQGRVKPILAKVKAIVEFPAPTNKKQLCSTYMQSKFIWSDPIK
jgi:hypothetical protein